MNTAQQTALAQAKQGNPEALAAIIRQSLAKKGIQVRVSRKGDLLAVALGSAQAPPKAPSLSFVKNGLTNLKVKNIRAVQVRGYKLGVTEPVWTDSIELIPQPKSAVVHSPIQDLSLLAKQGSLDALEQLLQPLLPDTEMSLVRYEEDHILISLSKSTQLKKSKIVELLTEELKSLEIEDVQYVLVNSYLQGDNTKLSWCERIQLSPLMLGEPIDSFEVKRKTGKVRDYIIAAVTICGMPFLAWGGFKFAHDPIAQNDLPSLNASDGKSISSRTNVARASSEICVDNFNLAMKPLASASFNQANQSMNIAIDGNLTQSEFSEMSGVLSTRMLGSCPDLPIQSVQVTSGEHRTLINR